MNAIYLLDNIMEIPNKIKKNICGISMIKMIEQNDEERGMTYDESKNLIENLNKTTMYKDWRLPTLEELESISKIRFEIECLREKQLGITRRLIGLYMSSDMIKSNGGDEFIKAFGMATKIHYRKFKNERMKVIFVR